MAYQSTPADRRRAITLGIIYLVLGAMLAFMLFKIWPPTPWPSDENMQKNPATKAALDAILSGCPGVKPEPVVTTTSAAPTNSAQTVLSSSTTSTPAVPVASVSPSGSPLASPTISPLASPSVTSSPTPSGLPPAGTQSTPAATPSAAAQALAENVPIKFFGQCINTSFDERLILLVIIAGILGSFVHASTSLADYIGNDNFNKNWTWFYLLRPAIGMSLALVFYFVIRGGFLTTSGGAKDINPFGIAALAGLVGMFSKQATDKLSEVFSTLFKASVGEGDDKRSGSLHEENAPTIASVTPSSLSVGVAGQSLTIMGSNFSEKSIAHLNNTAQKTTFVNEMKLLVPVDIALVASVGSLTLKVVNPAKGESQPTVIKVV